MAKRGAATQALGAAITAWSLVIAAPASGSTISVINTFDHGPGSLRDAIASAVSGDSISVTVAGTITLTSGPLLIRKDLTIVGPGPALLSIAGNHLSRVLTIADVGTATVTITGLTIRDGSADYGGGILSGGKLTLSNVVVSGSTAAFHGGAIFNGNGASLTLTNVRLTGNSAGFHGGGLYTETASISRVSHSVVSDNVAAVGGGISNHDGALSIEASTLTGNTAASPNGFSGGGIYSGGLGGSVSVIDSTIAHNSTSGEGGAVYAATGTFTVLNSTVSDNSSSCDSGGCASGGGIFNLQSTMFITNSTLAGNVSLHPLLGGNLTSLYGVTTVKNSILAGSAKNCLTYFASGIVSDGHNLSDDLSCITFLTHVSDSNGVAAGLSPDGLRDNGGPTDTISLLATSPAVDSVPFDACSDTEGRFSADQRGIARPQAAACDAGAFELILYLTSLVLNAPSPSSIVEGSVGPVSFTATLTQQGAGAPIAGAMVTFNVDGFAVGMAATDHSGAATFAYDPSSLTAGNHTVTAAFSRQTIEDASFEARSSDIQTIQVTPSPYAAHVQSPIRADGTSVFAVNRGVVPVKFALDYNGVATCQLPPATITVYQTAGTAVGPVNESLYVAAADEGSNFRIDTKSCQYVFNLGIGLLNAGSYRVSIALGPIVVGTAEFGLR